MNGAGIMKRYERESAKQSNFKSLWQEIANNLHPRRSDVLSDKTPGQKQQQYIYSSTPRKCNSRLAAVLVSMLTNTETKWFSLRLTDERLNKMRDVRMWLNDVSDIMHLAFKDSNFSMEVFEFFLDLGALCTSVMYLEEGTKNILRFKCIPITRCVIGEDPEGFVDTLFRPFRYTVRQAVMRWGLDSMPDKIKEAYDKQKYDDEFLFVHAVFPREDRNPDMIDSLNMPFASYYIEVQSKQIVAQGGYHEFCYMVSRWSKMADEYYGRGPGEEALPDIKELYDVAKTIKRAGKKAVAPPLDAVIGSYDHAIRTGPDQINWRNAGKDRLEALNLQGNLPYGEEREEKLKDDIRDTFYVTQLQLIDRKQMTLGEVEQRTRENLRILGPTFGRLVYEFLSPTIRRAYGILDRAGQIPEPPEVLIGQKFQVEYQSPLALVQQDQDIQAVLGSLEAIGPMIQVDPDVVDVVNLDNSARLVMRRKGMPADCINDPKVVEERRANRARFEEMQQQMEQVERGSNVRRALNG